MNPPRRVTPSPFNVDISDDELYALYLAAGRNASALANVLKCHPKNARERVRRMLVRVEEHPVTERRDPDLVNRVAELLERSNVDPNTIERIRDLKFKSYGIAAKVKGPDGVERLETEGLYSTTFSADPILAAGDNPCLTQAPPISVTYTPSDAPRIGRKLRTIVIVSDAQIGYINGPKGMESIHDPDAVDVTKELIAAVQPDELVVIGDWLDLTSFSRWPQLPEFEGCAQASIDAGSRILGDMIAAAGPQCKKRTMVSGNHDVRLERYAQANAKAFLGLRRAGLPKEWPVLSMPFLLRFSELGVDYGGLFPAGEYWIADDILAIHAPQRKLDFAAHIIHGHDHVLTRTTWAQHARLGRRNYFQYSVGCICRVGSRDTDPTSLMVTQTPSDRARTSWAQGDAVLEILDGKIPQHNLEHVHIQNGVAIYRGEVFTAQTLREAA